MSGECQMETGGTKKESHIVIGKVLYISEEMYAKEDEWVWSLLLILLMVDP